MEDNSKEEIKPSLEEQLEKSNSEATRLIQELESKKVEYSELLEDLNTQKEDISSILSEINTAKQTFIDDINKKLEEYSEKFTEVNSEIDTLKSNTEETFKTLDSEYNELINKYKTDLLYFLTDRYTKLRRLIEEYAFKSAISLALTPYYDLVQLINQLEMVANGTTTHYDKYGRKIGSYK